MSRSRKNRARKKARSHDRRKVAARRRPTPAIFISHRHADQHIASIVHDAFKDWGQGEIKVFRSTDPGSTTEIGKPLNSQLKKALSSAHLLVFIHTDPHDDWSYCIWEVGVATDPARARTRIAVIQFSDHSPAPFADEVRVELSEKGIETFTRQFHKKPHFFQGFRRALAPRIDEGTLRQRAHQLYQQLAGFRVTPRPKEDRRLWDFMTLRLDPATVKQVESQSITATDIASKAIVAAGGDTPGHFGYDELEGATTLTQLVARWKEKSAQTTATWVDGLVGEMVRAIRRDPPAPVSALLKSAREGTVWWFALVVTHIRRPAENDWMEFDVYLYRMPVDARGQIVFDTGTGARESGKDPKAAEPQLPSKITGALRARLEEAKRLPTAEGERKFEKLIQDFPDELAPISELARLYTRTGREGQALELLRRHDTAFASNADYYLRLGETLEKMGESDDAVSAKTTASELAPADHVIRLSLAYTHWQRSDFAKAIEQAERALELAAKKAPNDELSMIKNSLAYFYAERGDGSDGEPARRLAFEALEMGRRPATLDTAGFVLTRFARNQEDLDSAVQYLDEALAAALREDSAFKPTVFEHLEEAYKRRKDWGS